MDKVMTRTVRESLSFIHRSGGEIKILPAPAQYDNNAFIIHLRLNDTHSRGLIFDTDLVGRVLEECLDIFCNAIEKVKENKDD